LEKKRKKYAGKREMERERERKAFNKPADFYKRFSLFFFLPKPLAPVEKKTRGKGKKQEGGGGKNTYNAAVHEREPLMRV